MTGLGKPRSRFGHYIDAHSISQRELSKRSGVSRNTISRLAKSDDNLPSLASARKILDCLREAGHDVEAKNFWDI
ncbi:transcriptional regulator with XRE-family HTH domain [Geomicrobium halophilum]|uniref:Transcriptional regulator with XRE-family HTH domain n=2 Tax=Geomicrobium halophilum TaxID=549000 RepID=A0A841PY99_9BACL|nr:transcriptional regulator with XRE-family HTH domain [Geomicrobium halophilum]